MKPISKNVLVLYDDANHQICVAIVGLRVQTVFVCSYGEILRRAKRAQGHSTLYQDALQLMNFVNGRINEMRRDTMFNNARVIKKKLERHEHLLFERDPRSRAIDIEIPGRISRTGVIRSEGAYEIGGRLFERPGRPYRIARLNVSMSSVVHLSVEYGFEFHRHGFRRYIETKGIEAIRKPEALSPSRRLCKADLIRLGRQRFKALDNN